MANVKRTVWSPKWLRTRQHGHGLNGTRQHEPPDFPIQFMTWKDNGIRVGIAANEFRVRCIQPLCHLSAVAKRDIRLIRACFLHEGERSRQAGRLDARARQPAPLAAAAANALQRSREGFRDRSIACGQAPRAAVQPGRFLDRAVVSPHKTLTARALAGPRASFWPVYEGLGRNEECKSSLTGKSRSEGERAGRR